MNQAEQIPDVPPTMRLYTVTEARLMLGYSRSLMYELMTAGRILSVSEGRTRRISGTAIIDYIAMLEREASHPAAPDATAGAA